MNTSTKTLALKARIAALPMKEEACRWDSPERLAFLAIDRVRAGRDLLRDMIRERLVDGCAECGGFNVVFKPGADKHGAHYPPQTLPCPTCADWRLLLGVTKP